MKIKGLNIKNFGCFDEDGCEVKIDNIVVLIGQNNVGKSTILDAYEAYASVGKALPITFFHKENSETPIEITGIFTDLIQEDIDLIGKKWIHTDSLYGDCIKVKWIWSKPDDKGEKYAYDPEKDKFVKGGVGGWDSKLASRIPVPLRIRPTDSPETFEKIVVEILTTSVKDTLKKDKSKTNDVIKELEKLTEQFTNDIKDEIDNACSVITKKLEKIFPDYNVEFKSGIGKIEPEKIIGSGSQIAIKDKSNNIIPIIQQGSGLQRSFLWSALSALAETGRYKKGKNAIDDKPRILLIDEPEAFLHPETIRLAREALYEFAELENWQILSTTHSPVFIDVSKPHTTIIRVEQDKKWNTKLISTDKVSFEEDERKTLAMIRACHPTINEFFFADKVILVEGDTENAVFTNLLNKADVSTKYHIVNCFGKANIPMFQKILNQFNVEYVAIHDSDAPKAKRKDKWIKNGRWTDNKNIFNLANEAKNGSYSIAQVPNFEGYYFNESVSGDKPYNALQTLQASDFETNTDYIKLRSFVECIENKNHEGIYKSISDLEDKVKAWVKKEQPEEAERWKFE